METTMFPPGFLGTRADVLMDFVLLSFIVILPLLVWSWRLAFSARNFRMHRNIQISIAATLLIVVSVFEYDLKVSGGIFELTRGSAYEGTLLLNATIYVHSLFAVAASVIWVVLILLSLRRFDNPPEPNSFSARHRLWGRIGMSTMMLAGLTSPPLYYFGFVA